MKSCECCGVGKVEDDGFDVCPVCGWEDDGIQNEDPDYAGGANRLSLNDYRKKFRKIRKKNPDFIWGKDCKKPLEDY